MTYSPQDGAQDRKPERAAIFVDYENLYHTLCRTAEDRVKPAELVTEMIEALQRSLLEDRKAPAAVSRAYADFASLPGSGQRVQRSLYLQGVEPHFVPRERGEDAVELQLCVDAMDVLHHRADITTFVLLTGHRIYRPLVRMFVRYGRQVLVAGLDDPAAREEAPLLEGCRFFPARDLLSAAARSHVDDVDSRGAPRSTDRSREIHDPILLRTLEIIEEHFGQYEEVYLTPLLKKLSDLLDERRHDPKNLISDLEERGAARLEKRRGFPHDYTVLILEEHHPSVARLKAATRTSYYGEDDARHDHDDASQFDPEGSYRYNGDGAGDDAEWSGTAPPDAPALGEQARDDEAIGEEFPEEDRADDAPSSRPRG